ncbi:MAG: membrane dipeptidase [Chloroflexi bacterium]|nr:membrane dipeptidase [Chloroflexota bacterium]
MIIVDAHQDIAYNALSFGRDYRRSALETRQLERGTEVPQKAGIATLGLPDSLLGRVALVFATLFVAPEAAKEGPWDTLAYKNAQEAYRLAQRQMDYYQRLSDESDKIRLIRTQAELDALLSGWEAGKSLRERRQGLVILMENADPILEPRQFEEWYQRGVRIVGPAWHGTRYSGGTGQPGPLTDLGRALLEILADFGVILDVSHMAEEAFFESLDRYPGVLIASHSNPRAFRDTDRHLSDTMIRRLAERDGVMGIVPFNRFLSEHWSPSSPKSSVKLKLVLDAIDHVCQISGSAAHVGIGSDFDGGFGMQSIPEEMDTIMDLWNIGAALRARGYSEADIAAVLGGNMLRKLRQALR